MEGGFSMKPTLAVVPRVSPAAVVPRRLRPPPPPPPTVRQEVFFHFFYHCDSAGGPLAPRAISRHGHGAVV